MTTLIVQLTPALARDFAAVADHLGVSHTEAATEAVRLFIRAVAQQPANVEVVDRGRRKK